MNYKAYKARACRDFNRTKLLIIDSAEEKFIWSLKFKGSRKRERSPWTDCAFLMACLCRGWRRMAFALLNEGYCVTYSDPTEFSQMPLFHALRLGETEIAKEILWRSRNNAEYLNLSVRKFGSMDGYNALHVAVAMGDKEMVLLLLIMNHTLINHKDKDGWTPLHVAWYCWLAQKRSQLETEEIIDLILMAHDEEIHNSVNNHGLSHFHIACTRSNAKVVQGFLDRGVNNINAKVDLDEVHLAGCTALFGAVQYNRKDVVQVLLQKPGLSDVNVQCQKERTALFEAARFSYFKFYALMRDLTLVDEVDSQAWEANCQDQLAIIEMLAKRGGILFMENRWWNSIIYLCWRDNHTSFWQPAGSVSESDNLDNEISIEFLNRIAKKDFFVRRKKIVYKLLDNDTININTRDKSGKTILHYLVAEKRRGNIKFVQSLIRRNADLNITNKDADGQTILDVAITNCQVKMVRLLLNQKVEWSSPEDKYISSPLINAYALYNWCPKGYATIAELLIKKGIDVNVTDRYGNTPLHLAAAICHAPTIRRLLDAGSDINIPDSAGSSAFMRLFTPHLSRTYRNLEYVVEQQIKSGYEVLQQHVIKLSLIGIQVNKSVVIDCWFMSPVWNLDHMENMANIENLNQDFFCECVEEIKQLKAVRLTPYFTLYDLLLFKDDNKLYRCTESDTLKKILRDVAEGKNFPIYGSLLQMKNKKWAERLTLVKRAEKRLGWLLRDILPIECSIKILDYLENKDLNVLLKD